MLGRFARVVALLLFPLSVAGCGPGEGDVTGTVTYKGKKLGSGSVVFHGPNVTKTTSISADGTYTLKKVPAGSYKITVETFAADAPGKGGKTGERSTMIIDGAPAPEPGEYVPIPPKFKTPDSSGLTYEVTKGSQQKDIPLTD